MGKRTAFSIRVDPDLYRLLKQKGRDNFTAFVEGLIVKGLIVDMNEMYESAINATAKEGGIYRKTIEQEEIIKLNKRAEEMEKELKYQHKLLINICILGGMDKERVSRHAKDIEGAKDYKGRLRFHNRLIADIARTKNHTIEDITNWMKDD